MISIIVPVYNGEKWLRRCLDSILKMSFSDYELIIVNDGSTDDTYNILNYYKEYDQRIKVINKSNGGSGSARNVGISLAIGDYISFIDSDDMVDEDFLSILYKTMIEYDVDIVECNFESILNDKSKIKRDEKNYKVNVISNEKKLEEFCNKNTYLKTAVLWNKLFKKKLFSNLKFVENKGIDDEFLIHLLIYRANTIAVIDKTLYFYCLTENSQMRSKRTLKQLDSIEAIENQLNFFLNIKKHHLYNMLLYRYYATIMLNYEFVKNEFPKEYQLINELKMKRKTFYKALSVKETTLFDKVCLLLNRYFPKTFYKIQDYRNQKYMKKSK